MWDFRRFMGGNFVARLQTTQNVRFARKSMDCQRRGRRPTTYAFWISPSFLSDFESRLMVPLKSAKCFCVGWAIKTNFWNRKKLRVCLSKFEFEIRIRNFVFQNVDPLPPWKLYPVRFWNQNPRNRDQSGTGSSMGGRVAPYQSEMPVLRSLSYEEKARYFTTTFTNLYLSSAWVKNCQNLSLMHGNHHNSSSLSSSVFLQ